LNRNPECSKQNTSNKDPLQELTEKELQAVCKYVKGNETAWVPGRKHTKPGIWPHLQQNFRQNKKRHNIQKKKTKILKYSYQKLKFFSITAKSMLSHRDPQVQGKLQAHSHTA